jgi:hypothetical protein
MLNAQLNFEHFAACTSAEGKGCLGTDATAKENTEGCWDTSACLGESPEDWHKSAITQSLLDKCDKYEGGDTTYLGKHIDYKTIRSTLWDTYNTKFSTLKAEYGTTKGSADADKLKKKTITCCIKNLFKYMFDNIDKVSVSNTKKKKQINDLQILINDNNKEIQRLDKKIEEQKMYDEIKQSRIISSDKVRVSSITEYYIYIGLIVVFLLIQISLLVF